MRRLAVCSVVVAVCCGGCVEVNYVVKMNRDGSGRIEERIVVLPRAWRLMKGHGKGETFYLLSDEAVKERARMFGEVEVVSKRKLEGGRGVEVVYAFKDVNRVHLWIVPTMRCQDPKADGMLRFKYRRITYSGWSKKYYHTERLELVPRSPRIKKHYSAPAVVQDYRRIVPLFEDMLKDFRFRIEIEAPEGIETFEDRREMVKDMWIRKNRVICYSVEGENLLANPEIIRMFLMGEVNAEIFPRWNEWKHGVERAIPHTITPYAVYGNMRVRFVRVPREVPPPTGKGGKKK